MKQLDKNVAEKILENSKQMIEKNREKLRKKNTFVHQQAIKPLSHLFEFDALRFCDLLQMPLIDLNRTGALRLRIRRRRLPADWSSVPNDDCFRSHLDLVGIVDERHRSVPVRQRQRLPRANTPSDDQLGLGRARMAAIGRMRCFPPAPD